MDRVLIGLILGDQAFVVIVLTDHFVEIRMQKADQKDKIKRTLAPKLTDGQLFGTPLCKVQWSPHRVGHRHRTQAARYDRHYALKEGISASLR
jgi:hypothetical protein